MEQAIKENPDAVAVLVNNPTYYGICSDIRSIVKLAHAHGMKVLAERHMEHTCILEKIFRFQAWKPVLIWPQSPCISPVEA